MLNTCSDIAFPHQKHETEVKPHTIKRYGFERQAKGVHNHECTQRRTHKYANTYSLTDSTNEYTNATASFPSLCGQEEHSRHIISECFSSQRDNMSAPVPVTTPHRIDIHQLCSSLGHNTTMPKNMTLEEKLSCIYLPIHTPMCTRSHLHACVGLHGNFFSQRMKTTSNSPHKSSDVNQSAVHTRVVTCTYFHSFSPKISSFFRSSVCFCTCYQGTSNNQLSARVTD